MKKLLFVFIITTFYLGASAQNIVKFEYFWDQDPGVGNGIEISVASGSLFDGTLSIDNSGQSAGLHSLGIRSQTDDGKWSVPSYRRIYIHEWAELEYFWDTDPGVGNGTSIPVSFNNPSINETVAISTDGVSGGSHELGIRARELNGHWGAVKWKAVTVSTEFAEGEYFWDTDPGVGNGTSFSLPPEQNLSDATVSISTNGLTRGSHYLYVRTRESGGSFGFTKRKRVFVAREIVGGEYFWDTDPGVGNGIPLGTIPMGVSGQVCDAVSTVGLTTGVHYLYVRSVSDDGVWSVPSRILMNVTESTILVGCLGDFNRDGMIASADLLSLLAEFGSSGSCTVDLNGDFEVNTSDLLALLSVFGESCE